jgi:restriction system protein
MAVPDFQSLMLPLLKLAEDAQEHTNREAIDFLAVQFELTDDDKRDSLHSTTKDCADWRRGACPTND